MSQYNSKDLNKINYTYTISELFQRFHIIFSKEKDHALM